MVGIREIAREVGVSISTVSYALNGTRPISEATRKLVLEAVERLGYRPDARGRSLGAMRSQVVGLVIPSLTTYYIAPLLAAIDEALFACGYRVLIGHAGNHKAFHRLFDKGQVDGLIAIISLASGSRDFNAWTSQLKESDLPCVVINRSLPGVACVRTNYKAGALTAVNHLIQLGHQQIGFVGENPKDPTQVDLLAGYLQALKENGLRPDKNWIAKDSVSAFDQWKMNPPTGAFVAGQYHTFPFYREARAQRILIPEDIAVVGFDDDTNEADLSPGLTTVSQPHQLVGKTAVDVLMQGIQKNRITNEKMLVSPKLVVRDSCGKTQMSMAVGAD